ncbi:MAG: DUF2397 family protein, partial [Acetatifactor sp.]|nr:DUF2397 family protein [Acetatifactor sp.]
TAIEQTLKNCNPESVQKILEQVTDYELSIPRIDVEITKQQIYERLKGRFENIQRWFVEMSGMGRGGEAKPHRGTALRVMMGQCPVTAIGQRLPEMVCFSSGCIGHIFWATYLPLW